MLWLNINFFSVKNAKEAFNFVYFVQCLTIYANNFYHQSEKLHIYTFFKVTKSNYGTVTHKNPSKKLVFIQNKLCVAN